MTVDISARLAEVMPGIRRDLEDLVRIQSVSADPARAGEVERSAEATRDLFAAEGFECRDRPRPRRRAAGRDREEGRPRGCSDGPALRPPRRPARERPRRLGLPAVGADRARRPALRPRRRRRQGRHRRPPRRGPDLRRRPAGQPGHVHRGRGGGRLRHPRRAARGPQGAPRRRRHRHRRLRQLGHRRARPHHVAARPGPDGRRGPHAHPRRPQRHVGRPRPRLDHDAEPGHRLA